MAQFKMWTFSTDISTSTTGDDLFETDPSKQPAYTNCSVQQYFPKKVSHTLLNGNLATFTPNIRHRITVDFAFITASQYQIILANFNQLVVIQPEFNTSTSFIPTSLQSDSNPRKFKVLWADDGVDFTYSDTYKGAGYSGTVNFLDLE